MEETLTTAMNSSEQLQHDVWTTDPAHGLLHNTEVNIILVAFTW